MMSAMPLRTASCCAKVPLRPYQGDRDDFRREDEVQVRTAPLIFFSFSKATMSTAGSELAFNRFSCSVSAA